MPVYFDYRTQNVHRWRTESRELFASTAYESEWATCGAHSGQHSLEAQTKLPDCILQL